MACSIRVKPSPSRLGVQNSGGPGVVCTGALTTGTLQASGGVTNPSGPQIYGDALLAAGPDLQEFHLHG